MYTEVYDIVVKYERGFIGWFTKLIKQNILGRRPKERNKKCELTGLWETKDWFS